MTTSSDRRWMYKRQDSLGYLCMHYVSKVEKFLDFAYSNEATVENKLTREGGIVRRISQNGRTYQWSIQLEFVDEKSRLFVEKVKGLLSEKHGPNEDDYPDFDPEIWAECTGGKKKGKFYGSSTSQDPCYVLTGTPSSLSSCSSYTTQQPQVQMLTQTVEEMKEKHEIQQREIEEMKKREERQKKELDDLKAKNESETQEMKATIATLMKYLPNMTPQP